VGCVIKQAASRRPCSLHEVAERTRSGQFFDPGLREFLDEFYGHNVLDRPRRSSAAGDR
jgi:hypothetical protein